MPDLYSSKNQNKSLSPDIGAPDGNFKKTPRRTHNPLTSYSFNPENVKFDIQEDQEKVILLLRQHPIVNIPWIIIAALLFFAPALFTWFPIISFMPSRFQSVAILFWYLIASAYVVESALSWFFNVYLVTDERIIDVDFKNLIYREVSETGINKIQDTETRVGSVVRTLFNYGDVVVQTAGAVPEFKFEAVPNPEEIMRIINELCKEEEQEAIEGRVR